MRIGVLKSLHSSQSLPPRRDLILAGLRNKTKVSPKTNETLTSSKPTDKQERQLERRMLLRNSSGLLYGNELKAHGFGLGTEIGFLAFLIADLIGGKFCVVEFLTGSD
jgi:hypothetical protein